MSRRYDVFEGKLPPEIPPPIAVARSVLADEKISKADKLAAVKDCAAKMRHDAEGLSRLRYIAIKLGELKEADIERAISGGTARRTNGNGTAHQGMDLSHATVPFKVEKCGTKPQWQPNGSQPPPAPIIFKSARADTFKMKAITWLWPDRFAIGKLGIIAGLPDEGKGQILCDMAARITRGLPWPCNEGTAPQGKVIHLSAEDDPEDTIVPRLAAAGADLSRIELLTMVQEKGKDRMFSLITDLQLLRQKIIEVGDVRMVQIDPISAYLGVGKIDSFRTTDVRAVLAPLVDLAAEMKVSIIGIMHFAISFTEY